MSEPERIPSPAPVPVRPAAVAARPAAPAHPAQPATPVHPAAPAHPAATPAEQPGSAGVQTARPLVPVAEPGMSTVPVSTVPVSPIEDLLHEAQPVSSPVQEVKPREETLSPAPWAAPSPLPPDQGDQKPTSAKQPSSLFGRPRSGLEQKEQKLDREKGNKRSTRARTPLAAQKSSTETRPEAARAKRPLPKSAIYGLGALLLISGALVARSLLSGGPSVEAATTLSQTTSPTLAPATTPTSTATGTSTELPTSSASATTAPVVVSTTPQTTAQVQSTAALGKSTDTQQSTTEKTGGPSPSTSNSVTEMSALTADPVVQPDPTVSNAFHFSTVVTSKSGRASRQETASANTGVVNVGDASRFSASGRAAQQDVPTVQAEMLPAQALPVQAKVSQTPPITLPTRAYVPPAYVPAAATPLPAVQSSRALPVTVTPARTPGTQSFTQTFTAPGSAASASPRSGVGSVATGSPSVTFTPAQANYKYLGYAESDGDTLAVIHLGNRDETVAQGQLIPGTQTQLLSVTPARVTLKTDRIITQIPLEAQP